MSLAHKGQILPIVNQMIPIDKTTVFHANYDYDLNGFNQGELLSPLGHESILFFDGSSGYISIPNVAEMLHGGTEATLEMWVKKSSVQYGFIQLSGFANSNGNLYPYTTNDVVYLDIFRNNRLGPITMKSSTTNWHHFAVTTAPGANGWKLYQNGELVYQTDGQATVSTNYRSFEIGRNSDVRYAHGEFSDVRVWKIARTQEEIKKDMNRILTGNENGLVAYYKLTENRGPTALDSSGNGNDGIWNGTITSIPGLTVATIKKEEGKFKGAALIEPETYNAFKANEWSRDTADVTIVPIDHAGPTPSPTYLWSGSTKSSAGNCYLNGNTKIDFELFSTKWTFSCYLKRADGQPVTDVGHIYMYAEAQGGTTRINVNQAPTGIIDCGDGWYRVYRTETVTGLAKISLCGFSSLNKTTEWYINGWMLEPRFGMPSSYLPITNSRAVGRLTYPNPLQDKNNFTISLWMKRIDQVNQRDAVLCIQEKGIDQNGVWIDIDTGMLRTFVYPSSGAAFVAMTTEYDVSNWCHITVTGTENTLKLFVNGKLKATQVISSPYKLTGVLSIGRRLSNAPYNDTSNIMVDELRIEARAISEEEVLAWAVGGLHYNYLDYSQYVD